MPFRFRAILPCFETCKVPVRELKVLAKRAMRAELISQIGAWNERYPIATDVRTQMYPDRVYKTRTKALVLFDRRAAIYLQGLNGYFDLNDVRPADGAPPPVEKSMTAPILAPKQRIALLFAGQGFQFKGMGQGLFTAFPELVRRADEILGYSIQRLCLEDPDNQLNMTQYTQVALYIVNALGYELRAHREDSSVEADFLMGHSLGEYNALLAAGAFDFETGLRLVVERGKLMGEVSGGAMAAVLDIAPERLQEILAQHALDAIDLANYNTPTQTAISGTSEAIARALDMLSAHGIRAVRLNVSAAFHSRHMRQAQQTFAGFVEKFSFKTPQRPVIANATARPYKAGRIAQTLSEQIASPVRWTDSVRYVLSQGEIEFTEINSSILSRMVKEIASQ